MLTLHQLLGNKQPQTPDTTLRQRQHQRHEHTALSPETPDLNSFTMPPERKRTFYSMRQIDMLSKEDLITTRFPRFWRMQSCLTQIPLGLWAVCTIVLMSALILMEGCFYLQQEQGQDLSPLNQGRSLLVALQQDQVLSLPQSQMQALSPSQALTLSPAALDPETNITVATTAQLANTSALGREAYTDK